ncbi:MAG TPA: zf-HC2 domain-containing protein [Myxococcota bacterium]|jgi:anti-sigma factor (TIGR02949 family)|nr:zf-HC2 domain-containing protein [Myxococcota bacterium]
MPCCKDCVDFLADFLDGALPEAEAEAFRDHLEDCPPCMAFVDTYKKTSSVCRQQLAVEMPPELGTSILAFLRARIQEPD